MIELILIIILVSSLIGLAVILFRKMPELAEVEEPAGSLQNAVVVVLKKGVGYIPVVRDFSYEMYLQKMLSRFRILTLKTENKTSGWLEKLRQKSSRKNNHNNDGYWDELKKAKDGK